MPSDGAPRLSGVADDPMQAKSVERLREMTDEELVKAHDSLLTVRAVGVEYYLAELARRDADRQTRTIVQQTGTMVQQNRTMVVLTRVITVLTVANVVAVVYSIAS